MGECRALGPCQVVVTALTPCTRYAEGQGQSLKLVDDVPAALDWDIARPGIAEDATIRPAPYGGAWKLHHVHGWNLPSVSGPRVTAGSLSLFIGDFMEETTGEDGIHGVPFGLCRYYLNPPTHDASGVQGLWRRPRTRGPQR